MPSIDNYDPTPLFCSHTATHPPGDWLRCLHARGWPPQDRPGGHPEGFWPDRASRCGPCPLCGAILSEGLFSNRCAVIHEQAAHVQHYRGSKRAFLHCPCTCWWCSLLPVPQQVSNLFIWPLKVATGLTRHEDLYAEHAFVMCLGVSRCVRAEFHADHVPATCHTTGL